MSRRPGTPRHPTAKQKGGWSPEEDALLISLVKKHGEGQWSPIARALNEAMGKTESTGRIGKQCRERWNHHLCPGLRKGPWTPEEEALVVEAHRRLGNHWSDIARRIPGRSENAVKNHWNATLRKRITPENPAGPLKEYLDTLHLTVTPRRRNGGGGGGGGTSGSKRRRNCRDHDDSTSEESAESTDDDADTETHPDSVVSAPKDMQARRSNDGAAMAIVSKHVALSQAATVAAGPFATAAVVSTTCVKSRPPGMPTTPTGTQRFPSDTDVSIRATVANRTKRNGAASGNELVPPARATVLPAAVAATSHVRRRSKRVAAQVGNERLRNLAEAEQREAAAEAEFADGVGAGTVSTVAIKLEPQPSSGGGNDHRVTGGDVKSMDTQTGPVSTAFALTGGSSGLPAAEPEPSLHSRPSSTESICESGIPTSEQATRAQPVTGAPIGSVGVVAGGAVAGAAADAGDKSGSPTAVSEGAGGAAATDVVDPVDHPVTEAAGSKLQLCIDQPAAVEPSPQPIPGLQATVWPNSPTVPALPSDGIQNCVPGPQGDGGNAVPGPGWASLAPNWSTNNMQMLATGQQSRRSSYGVSMGGKIRPPACSVTEGVAAIATALTAVPMSDGTTAAAAAAAFAARASHDDDELLLETAFDYSGTLCLRHVASGSALLEYGPDLTAVTAPSSPPATAGATGSMAALTPLATPPMADTWAERQQQLSLPGRTSMPGLFGEPHLGLGPYSPLRQSGAIAFVETGREQDRGSGNVPCSSGTRPSMSAAMAFADISIAVKGEAATAAAPMNTLAGTNPAHVGFDALGDCGACVVSGVAANSSITSVGSPLSDLYEYSDSGARIGDPSGARPCISTAAAAVAPSVAAAAYVLPDTEGQVARSQMGTGVLLKRESSINGCTLVALQQLQQQQQQQGATSGHVMAPFKVTAPPPLSASVGAQTASPWTPIGATSLVAPAPQTVPAAPASPVPWGVKLPPGQATGAPMPMPYTTDTGPAGGPQQLPALTAPKALPLAGPMLCYPVPPPNAAAVGALPQQPLHAPYGGAQVLHGGHMAPFLHGIVPPEQSVYYVPAGFYCYSPGPYNPFGGMFGPLPYHPMSGQPPAMPMAIPLQIQMPTPLEDQQQHQQHLLMPAVSSVPAKHLQPLSGVPLTHQQLQLGAQRSEAHAEWSGCRTSSHTTSASMDSVITEPKAVNAAVVNHKL